MNIKAKVLDQTLRFFMAGSIQTKVINQILLLYMKKGDLLILDHYEKFCFILSEIHVYSSRESDSPIFMKDRLSNQQ